MKELKWDTIKKRNVARYNKRKSVLSYIMNTMQQQQQQQQQCTTHCNKSCSSSPCFLLRFFFLYIYFFFFTNYYELTKQLTVIINIIIIIIPMIIIIIIINLHVHEPSISLRQTVIAWNRRARGQQVKSHSGAACQCEWRAEGPWKIHSILAQKQ